MILYPFVSGLSQSKVFLSGGESLDSKTTVNYYSQSLFVNDCPANQNKDFHFVFDWDEHLQLFTEQYSIQRYGALYIDYLYTMPEVSPVTTGYFLVLFNIKYNCLGVSSLQSCMVCSRSRVGLYHSRFLGLIGLSRIFVYDCL